MVLECAKYMYATSQKIFNTINKEHIYLTKLTKKNTHNLNCFE